jgi:putative transposase
VKGRKRHLIVDTLGLVLKVFVTEANYADSIVARWLLPLLLVVFPRLRKLWADTAYRADWPSILGESCPLQVEIVERPPGTSGFKLLPHRWIVERTFAWLTHFRRLSKDYEYWVYTSDAMIYAAMVRLMLGRLTRC